MAWAASVPRQPEPGNTTTPIGRTSSNWWLRLNGAALAWRVKSGLKATCGTFRLSAQQAAIRSAPFGDPPAGFRSEAGRCTDVKPATLPI